MPKNILHGLKSIRIGVLNSGKWSFGATNVQFIIVQILGMFESLEHPQERWDICLQNYKIVNTVETLCLHYRDLYLIRWRLHAQATKFQHL
jgi:hypothetical protein